MDGWQILALALALAVLFFIGLWRRTVTALTKAEELAAQTERALHNAQQAATQSTAYLTALQQAQTEAVLFISPDRHILEWNPTAQTLFAPSGALGQTLFLATRSLELDQLITRALAGEMDCDQQVLLSGALPYRARAIQAGRYGVALVLQDLSVLQRLGRARRDFVANLSHDLRTPLTSIRLLVESLQTGIVTSREDIAGGLQKINIEIRALEQMAQELLDLAQIESGKTIVKLVPTSLARLVTETLGRFEPQVRQKQQTMEVEVPPDLVVLADAEKLNRALGNLVHNAIKFTPERGHIHVRAYPHEAEAWVEVADTGPGISPEDLPRVFERFFRGDRSRASGGTGLGLAVAKHIVEAHGGRLWAESEGRPGQGAVFRFTLLMDH